MEVRITYRARRVFSLRKNLVVSKISLENSHMFHNQGLVFGYSLGFGAKNSLIELLLVLITYFIPPFLDDNRNVYISIDIFKILIYILKAKRYY